MQIDSKEETPLKNEEPTKEETPLKNEEPTKEGKPTKNEEPTKGETQPKLDRAENKIIQLFRLHSHKEFMNNLVGNFTPRFTRRQIDSMMYFIDMRKILLRDHIHRFFHIIGRIVIQNTPDKILVFIKEHVKYGFIIGKLFRCATYFTNSKKTQKHNN